MTLDRPITRQYLQSGNLQKLFNEMGWDNPGSKQPEMVEIDEQVFSLFPIAEKRGVKIYRCDAVPDGVFRKKIERQIAKSAFEHLIVFVSPDNSKQVWQWVARRKGEADRVREYAWETEKSPELLIQKLDHITFSLDEEEGLTLSGTTRRLQDAFDREIITKRFYESFKKEHKKFLGFIEGLTDIADKQWYASLMLNRLMFVYFIQKKGFLDDDFDYLRERFRLVKETQGRDKFHSFYRAFLLKLFHGGLATPVDRRDEETARLIGDIPYLNGGLFEPHVFEGEDSQIQVSDKAFESIFDFFEQYEWTLDTRPIERADGREINPDVLGHIFEKYINQKEMGAYYTKEDITGYITENTVIPWLFRRAESLDRVAFAADGFVWRQLRENAEKYIYADVAHGVEHDLPDAIAAGIEDVSKRGDWNKAASLKHGLETEIWRDAVTRRQRYFDIRKKIASGEIRRIEDLITYNLNIQRFAQDVIDDAESPDLVRAFWKGISSIKVLDPACGSGAFLFAALNVLHNLYEACLERMEQFVNEAPPPKDGRTESFSDFRKILNEVAKHPNLSYFIYKRIIISNLYGVDIMDEAVEICKLRLFLKLAAQLERGEKMEPLPDIDFNIRAGNSLIGYTSEADMSRAIEKEEVTLDFDNRIGKIKKATQDLAKAFAAFRHKQTQLNGDIKAEDKKDLRDKVQEIGDRLDRLCAQDYDVKTDKDASFEDWRREVKPFHWWAEFYDIVDGGGFDAVIGNPPYLEASRVPYSPQGFKTRGTVHGYFVEQSDKLLSQEGGMSMILPMTLVSTKRMKAVQEVIETGRSAWYSNFSDRPSKLFDGVNIRFSIFVSAPPQQKEIFTTGYKKWVTKAREALMPTLDYVAVPEFSRKAFWVPKFQNPLEASIFDKVINQNLSIEEIWGDGPKAIYYRNTGVRYWYVITNFQPKFSINGVAGISSTQEKALVKKGYDSTAIVALLSSSVFWWWYTIRGDCWHLTKSDIQNFKTNPDIFDDDDLRTLGKEYIHDIKANSYLQDGQKKKRTIQIFKIQKSKPIIDKIDAVLARHYGFTAEELDFIQNYDIKFRVGASESDED